MSIAFMWILRVIILLLIIRFVMRLLSSVLARRPGATTRSTPAVTGGTLVRDPQCGTYVPQSRALVERSGDGSVYFCSAACRDAWRVAHAR